MPRYSFYSCSKSGAVVEIGGKTLMGPEDARAEAKSHIRRMMADAVACGRDISRRTMEIRDTAHKLVASIRFRDAVTRDDG
jgi:hypothetical protein